MPTATYMTGNETERRGNSKLTPIFKMRSLNYIQWPIGTEFKHCYIMNIFMFLKDRFNNIVICGSYFVL